MHFARKKEGKIAQDFLTAVFSFLADEFLSF